MKHASPRQDAALREIAQIALLVTQSPVMLNARYRDALADVLRIANNALDDDGDSCCDSAGHCCQSVTREG